MIVSERKRLVQKRFPIVKNNLLISVMICCHCDVKLPGDRWNQSSTQAPSPLPIFRF